MRCAQNGHSLSMPLFRRRTPQSAPAAAYPTASGPVRPRLLVCDDNESVTQLVQLLFDREGWSIEVVSDGEQCLEAIQRCAPDVVLLDQQLGGGPSGIETADIARERGFDGPVLLFSAYLDTASQVDVDRLDLQPVSKLDFPAVVRHVNAAHRAHRRAVALARGRS